MSPARVSGVPTLLPWCSKVAAALLACVVGAHSDGNAQVTPPPPAAASAQPQLRPGFEVAADVSAAAYRIPGVPSVIVHAPSGFDPSGPLHLVVYLHGYSGCVPVLMGKSESRCRPGDAPRAGWDLGAAHDAAGTNTLFIVPQLAFMKRSGRPGAFDRPGVFRQFLCELLSQTLASQLGGPRSLQDVASLTLVAHSAGYQAALAILQRGQVQALVRNVVLFDALYGATDDYARFALEHIADGLHLVALHLPGGRPEREDLRLHRRLARKLGSARVALTDTAGLDVALAEHAIVVASAMPPHWQVPWHYLAQVLAGLPLPRR
ncbi:MAG TPA: hypothetical protein VF331_21165 [Polyangiales bacterium]